MSAASSRPSVVVQFHIPCTQTATSERAAATEPLSECQSEHLSAQVISLDAYRINRDFPQRWQAYLRAHFACINDAALTFGVTERAARRWWNGAGSRGPFVTIALRLHPVSAPAYLLTDQPLDDLAARAERCAA